MDDNIIMEPCWDSSYSNETFSGGGVLDNGSGYIGVIKSWIPSHILDFSNMSIGNRLLLNSVCYVYVQIYGMF